MLNKDSNAHFTDEFKTSLHPSFSNESQYSGYKNKYNPEGITGGTWIDDYNYQLSQSQFDNDWNTDKTLDYFDNNEEHPVRLYAPDGSTMLRSVTVTPQSPASNKNALGGRVNKFDGTGNSTINRPRRVDVNRLTPELNRNRAINVAHMSQLQDSLIGRNYPEAQRLAIMATAAQEMDKRGSASKGVGGNGLLGLSKERMPLEYLEPDKTGEQIKYILDDLETIHSDNWNHGGSGGPKIQSAKDGYTQFWNATTPEEATMILNKSYIRPRDREAAWKNRANIATILKSFLTK